MTNAATLQQMVVEEHAKLKDELMFHFKTIHDGYVAMFDSLAETLEDAFGQLNCFIQEQQQSAEEKERRTQDLQIQIDTVKQNVAKLLQSVGL